MVRHERDEATRTCRQELNNTPHFRFRLRLLAAVLAAARVRARIGYKAARKISPLNTLTRSQHSRECKTHAGKKTASSSKRRGTWRRENPVSLALFVRRALQHGKPSVAYTYATAVILRSVWRPTGRCDLDLWPFDTKINAFPGLIVEHLCVKFGDPSWIGFWDIVWKKTYKPWWTLATRQPSAWEINTLQ